MNNGRPRTDAENKTNAKNAIDGSDYGLLIVVDKEKDASHFISWGAGAGMDRMDLVAMLSHLIEALPVEAAAAYEHELRHKLDELQKALGGPQR